MHFARPNQMSTDEGGPLNPQSAPGSSWPWSIDSEQVRQPAGPVDVVKPDELLTELVPGPGPVVEPVVVPGPVELTDAPPAPPLPPAGSTTTFPPQAAIAVRTPRPAMNKRFM